ncbi:MAG: lysophospholipid acyltransferase family protein [Wenzhouxiangellaceae bacterium]|nr:lysophospholipid acyltransferase family protein [Wenzhouxiangellaceae bacterium]
MSAHRLRDWRRYAGRTLAIRAADHAARGGVERIRRWGRLVGEAHYWLGWPVYRRLRRDIATALAVPRARAGAILRRAFRENDRAVFEIIALSRPNCDPDALVDSVRIDDAQRLEDRPGRGNGAILLGMHMGNGILMAARLAREGWPVHIVFRDPRRLPPGLLGRSIERAGCVPVPLDRDNPTRSFRRMLAILRDGGVIFALMDQANKREGTEKRFLGKRMRMPAGLPGLAVRTGVPIIPIHVLDVDQGWRFGVQAPLVAESADAMLDTICASMEQAIRARPELWAWHHRRWKRYPFEPEPTTTSKPTCR